MAWLSGYSKRIKLTIDYNKIDSSLSNFPVTVFFTSSQGEEIFDEFDADSDYMKCAFTSDNGTTQLYAEKELFDVSEEKAIYHVKVPSISSSANTIIYYYFDNSHSDNTDYIGAIGTTAGANVWDSNFKAVYHMVDATTSTIKDSTSNNNDGTKKAANEPIEATGKVGQGQDFDGTDDYINLGTLSGTDVTSGDLTLEVLCNLDGWGLIASNRFAYNDGNDYGYAIYSKGFRIGDGSGYANRLEFSDYSTEVLNAYHLISGVKDGSTQRLYLDDTQYDTMSVGNVAYTGDNTDSYMGVRETIWDTLVDAVGGIIDEVRYSSTARSAAWIKATYNSLWDTLLTYGSAEMSKNINETLHTVDTLAKSGIENISETLHIVDSILKSGTKALAESFNIFDSFFGLIHLTETLHLADSLAKSGIKQLGEVIAIIDELGVTAIKLMYETLHIADWFWGKLRRKISDWLKIEKNDTNWKKE